VPKIKPHVFHNFHIVSAFFVVGALPENRANDCRNSPFVCQSFVGQKSPAVSAGRKPRPPAKSTKSLPKIAHSLLGSSGIPARSCTASFPKIRKPNPRDLRASAEEEEGNRGGRWAGEPVTLLPKNRANDCRNSRARESGVNVGVSPTGAVRRFSTEDHANCVAARRGGEQAWNRTRRS